ncbi:signal peptidase I [Chromobacterium violaceum]|uniref:signal peptidase I n=1 Tax=Chromobacterium violaceum TaxID=536 RepID=UPI0009D9F9B5|nr:signal peptidase I [Chromobacterium violaceum]OQS11738.1 signal peptidase I [Chromobacterium violaceum]OQS29126.1 signal peptidase I [Chromobacterium violaceum]
MKNWLQNNRGFLVFLLLFGLFRTAVADWNPIPSGSMRPTLQEGDVVLVNRLAYDLKLPLTNVVLQRTGEPQRGDIVTFYSPKDGKHLIKRLVAVPGDTVEMRRERLIINGRAADYQALQQVTETVSDHVALPALRLRESGALPAHRVQWLAGVDARSDFGPLSIPAGQYMMLGDNRDNSADSRYIGLVPRELLIGRAVGVIASADITGGWMPRWERFASGFH